MANLVNYRHALRDASQNSRVAIKNGVTIAHDTFISFDATSGEIIKATSSSKVVGYAITGGVGATATKESLNYVILKDGDELSVGFSVASFTPKAGKYYTLANEVALLGTTESSTPITGAVNFLYNGRTFTVHTF